MHAEDFETLKCLGKGTYGTVFLVRHKDTGKLYAQKQFKKASLVVHKKVVEQTKTERAILESVRHPFVVKLYYAFQDKEKLYLILEYAQGGELFLHLALSKFFPETTAVFYLAELVLALSHLHQNVGVVYRDLKPENCLLDAEGHLLLTDFGLSKVKTDDSRCRSFLGTPEYMAPEILTGDGKREYGAEVDWWGVGALAVDLMTAGPPFTGNNKARIIHKIVHSKLSLPYYLSQDAKDLITRLLRKDPTKRLGHNMPKDLHTIKNHRFFRKIDWEKLERREIEPPIRPLITDPELAENFSTDFTELGLSSPVMIGRGDEEEDEEGLFGGFSFVASSSLLGERY
jgi:serine/threonine protein kinase